MKLGRTCTLLAPSSRNSAASCPVSIPPIPDRSLLLSYSDLMSCAMDMTCRQHDVRFDLLEQKLQSCALPQLSFLPFRTVCQNHIAW